MMLTLLAVSLNEKPLSQPITACFDAKGGTIGRADHNTMALPDPERHISRLQAEILVSGARYVIKNVGAANPITVAGRVINQGDACPLAHGDEVRIGGYRLQVVDDLNASGESSQITRGRAVASANAPRPAPMPSAMPLPDAAVPLSSNNPFADLLGTAPPLPSAAALAVPSDPFADLMPPPAGVTPGSAAVPARAGAAPAARRPDDFGLDPFANPAPAALAAVPEPRASQNPFDDLMPSAGPPSIDVMFDLSPGAGADPLADFMGGAAARAPSSAPAAGALSTDPLALFGGPDPARAPSAPAVPDNTPLMHQVFAAPKVAAPAPRPLPAAVAEPVAPMMRLPDETGWNPMAPPPPVALPQPPRAPVPVATVAPAAAPMPSSPPEAAAPAALWRSFCEGAGVDVDLPQGLTPEAMRMLGQLLMAAVEGTMQLMAVRTTTKQELRAGVTLIRPSANNPLKFSPDAAAGIRQLLRPPERGFLPGPTAMRDAMHDLLGHSIGTMAGMRAALDGVLGRFAPGDLDAKLSSTSLLDSILPMSRKARLWDAYLLHFESIRSDAQEDFDTLFGKAFVAAYEQQQERLREGRASR